MVEPADDTGDRPRIGAEALAYLLDARRVADSDQPPPTLNETLELLRLYHRQTPVERIGFMALARLYAQLDNATAGKLLMKAGKLVRCCAQRP